MNKRNKYNWFVLFAGFAMFFAGIFLNWHPVMHKPTTAEIQEALKNEDKIPRYKIYYFSEPMLIGSMAFDEIEEGPGGELEKVPSLGFCES